MNQNPVDAVITWVNGQDEHHAQKLTHYLQKQGLSWSKAAAPTRFNQCGELDYCVRSILYFAPWIRTLYIVTDEQIPPIIHSLKNSPFQNKVKRIDHKEIFSGLEEFLPTFNSLSIESLLWRIPELSEKFIYFNDDCLLIRPVNYEDFFQGECIISRGHWKRQSHKKWRHVLSRLAPTFIHPRSVDEHRIIQENSAQLSGRTKDFFHLPHLPFPLKKQTLADFFYTYPEVLKQNIRHPLRHPQQFWPISLAQHLEFNHHQAIVDNHLKALYINPLIHSQHKIQKKLIQAERENDLVFLCMQSLDMASVDLQNYLFAWLNRRLERRL